MFDKLPNSRFSRRRGLWCNLVTLQFRLISRRRISSFITQFPRHLVYRYTLYNSVNKHFSFVLHWAIFPLRSWSFTKYPSPFQRTSDPLTIVFLPTETPFNHIFPNNNTRFIVAPFVSCAGTGVVQCCSLEQSIGFTIYHLSFRFCLVKIMITVVHEAKNLGIPRCSTLWAIGQLFS